MVSMIFGPKPSKLEQARQAVADAAHDAASALSDAASSVAESAHSLADSAHSLVEKAPKIASSVGEVVSSKVEAVRHRGEHAVDEASDSVEAAQLKAAATKKAAEIAAKEAEKAALDAQKKTEAEIDRLQEELYRKWDELDKQQEFIESQAEKLAQQSYSLEEQASEIHTRRKAPTSVKVNDYDDGFEYEVVAEKESGSSLWLVVGAAVFIGAALVYFFAPGSGRRSRAAIKDRLSKVKDDAVDKVTGAADAASQKASEVTERAEDLSHRASDKLAEVADSSAPATASIDHAVETYEDTVPSDTQELAEEVKVAANDAVEGVAVDSSKELDTIETAATVAAQNSPQHPNIFDKVADIAGNAADAAEHFAGIDKEDNKEVDVTEGENSAEADAAPTQESTSANKKKKGK